jgi:uncharacterized protein YoxC
VAVQTQERRIEGQLILDISVAVAAISLVILVYFLVGFIRQAHTSMNHIQQMIQSMEHNVSELSRESIKLLQQSQSITEDIQSKLGSANTLFRSVEQVGASVHQVATSFKQVSATISQTVQETQKSVQAHRGRATLDWVLTGIQLWHKWQTITQERYAQGKKPLLKGDDSHV